MEQTAWNVNLYGPFFDLDLVARYTARRFIPAIHPIHVVSERVCELLILSIGFDDTELRHITGGDGIHADGLAFESGYFQHS